MYFMRQLWAPVPRSINDPQTTNEVNISGFLNMLVAARDAGVRRFVYAASSSTYGDSQNLPKVEEVIGRPLSPYAITKYVNELYAMCSDGYMGWNVSVYVTSTYSDAGNRRTVLMLPLSRNSWNN